MTQCDRYIEEQYRLNPTIDRDKARDLYPQMLETLIDYYLIENIPTKVEQQVVQEVKDNIFIAGTYDALIENDREHGTILVDYKNVSKKPSKVEDDSFNIPFNYKIQLLTYALALREGGQKVDSIRLVYVVRPTTKLPVRVYSVTRPITESDWQSVESVLNLIIKSVLRVKKEHECASLIFKSLTLDRPKEKITFLGENASKL
jgi:hypothetical protein